MEQGLLASLIRQTADSIGANPLDLATLMSYETGGTFDPKQAGPTTQWGQHRGLIQFGEPQAQQYGVDWDDPLNSQLGADGAIAKYFRSNGYEPGMGLLDMYSIVNAGGPGRYNATDENNGGAPGSVADKVHGQMAGHRDKAAGLLGYSFPDMPQMDARAPQPQLGYDTGKPVDPAKGFSLLASLGEQIAPEAPAPMPEYRNRPSSLKFRTR